MELWIRNQNKNLLTKVNYIEYSFWNEQHRIYSGGEVVGIYDSKERALEVLDEIQNKMNPKYFYKTNCLMKPEQLEKMETILQQKYNADFIVGSASDEIEPLSNDVLVYEMPEE